MRPHRQVVLSVTLLTTLACGGGSGERLGTELCTKKEGNDCASPATEFATDSPVLYVIHRTTSMPKLHQVYVVDWTAVDAGSAVPAGTVLASVQIPVEDEGSLNASTNWTVESELTPPGGVWPPGSYKATITLDGTPVTEAPFTIR